MDIVTVGLIVIAAWIALLVAVVAICKAAAFGDAASAPVPVGAEEAARASGYVTAGERSSRLFDRPALG